MGTLKNKVKKEYFWAALESLPVFAATCVTLFSIGATVLLLLGVVTNELLAMVSVLSCVAALCIAKKLPPIKRPGLLKSQRRIDLLVIIGVLLWGFINLMYASQSVFIYRDPAIYSASGAWLANNSSLKISPSNDYKETGIIQSDTAGYSLRDNQLKPQGQRLLSVFFATFARLGGISVAFKVNIFIAMVALLTFYGYARLLGKPKWAVLSTAGLAVSLPFLYFSRDTFTEPLSLLFIFGALNMMWLAEQHRKKLAWFVSGLMLGATTLSRVDGFLFFITIAVFFIVKLCISHKGDRLKSAIEVSVATAACALVYVLSYLDLTLIGNAYQSKQRMKMTLLFGAVVIVGILATGVIWKLRSRYNFKLNTKKLGQASVFLFALASLVMISRPLWLTSHHSKSLPLVAGLQADTGQVVDPTRDYAENTINWLMWYLGPVIVIAGLFGMAIVIKRIIENKEGKYYLPGIITVVGVAAVFLNRPSITPDQVWAARRLLPVLLPGFAAFAVVGFTYLERVFVNKFGDKSKVLTPLLYTSVLLPILFISEPYLAVKTKAGQLNQINDVCRYIESSQGTVVWIGKRSFNATQAVKSYCNKEIVRMNEASEKNLKILSREVKQRDEKITLLVFDSDWEKLSDKQLFKKVSEVEYSSVPSTLSRPPRAVEVSKRAIYAAEINQDGSIAPSSH